MSHPRKTLLLVAWLCPAMLISGAWQGPAVTNAGTDQPRFPPATRSESAADATLAWYLQTVGAPPQKWFHDPGAHYLRLDATGDPHVAYGGDHLYYARHDGIGWRYETVDGAEHVGAGASLALDRAGAPHISYCDQANRALKYARWIGVTWEIRQITDAGWCDRTALALDETDQPHIVYVTGGVVKYAHWTGREWDIQARGNGPGAELVLDHVGHPHIAYAAGDGNLRYTWYDGQNWRAESIVSGSCLHGCTAFPSLSLALGPQDDPRVSYILAAPHESGSAAYRLGYAQRTDGLWGMAAEVEIQSGAAAVALAVDAAGKPHIGYQDGLALKYRRWTGSAWDTQVVESVTSGQANAPPGIALALDLHDVPHLGYLRAVPQPTGGDAWQEMAVRHVALREATWAAETVDQTLDTGLGSALALDIAGGSHQSYRDRRGALRYATWASSHWASEIVDATEGTRIGQTALALDGAGAPHIGYISPDGALKYAHRTADGWQITPVTSPLSGELAELSFALDHTGRPHISYTQTSCFTCAWVLKYAHWTGDAWEFRNVETLAAGASPQVALAVDTADLPQLLYTSDHTLRYARWNGSAWMIQDVDTPVANLGISLALDRAGMPRASYVADDGSGSLKYATLTEQGWQIQRVAAGDPAMRLAAPALALDSADTPQISYHRTRVTDAGVATQELQYAHWTGTAWDSQRVETIWPGAGDAQDLSSALAVDRNGLVHISFYDPTLHAPRYAIGSPPRAPADCGPAPTLGLASTGAPPASGTVTRQIGHCLDDAYVVLGKTTELANGNPYLRMGGRPGTLIPYVTYVDGLLFRDMQIPQGAQIISATLRMTTWFYQGMTVSAEVAGELSLQASDFRAANPWPHQRPKTRLRIPWTVSGIVPQIVESPDLAAVVQEIVGQGDWQAGNNLALLISPALTGDHYVDWRAYDFQPAGAAQLNISYRTPTPPTPRLYLPLMLSH